MKIHQAAAIPYRRKKGYVEFCLVTARRTGYWTFPKGTIEGKDTSEKTALKEAEEEAGLTGEIEGDPIGVYRYPKAQRKLNVEVHLMRVDKAAKEWEEDRTRDRRWFDPEKARSALPYKTLRLLLDVAVVRLELEEEKQG